uniref:Fc receptor gamma-chain n=1 Tax=Cyprinodon variegatus TaxID=28743 RepID=A0A3Q2CG11_CYPVA
FLGSIFFILKELNFSGDMVVCYILDGVLILYGIILTILYCRLRVRRENALKFGSDFTPSGLTSKTSDTYETINMSKKPIV